MVAENKIWITDNSGYISGPLKSVRAAIKHIKELQEDKYFVSQGNLCIVRITENCDNLYHGIEVSK